MSLDVLRIGSLPRQSTSSVCLGYVVFLDVYPTATAVCCVTIKFPYNAPSDWLKQSALSENRVQIDNVTLSKFLLWKFDKSYPS